ncbi:hypothetical protein [Brevundimonas diminuta]|uniref:hypothetical protein n=1 Tax=Brevundimonas diminuta TaxID=293 RepID=UPI003F7F9FA3
MDDHRNQLGEGVLSFLIAQDQGTALAIQHLCGALESRFPGVISDAVTLAADTRRRVEADPDAEPILHEAALSAENILRLAERSAPVRPASRTTN